MNYYSGQAQSEAEAWRRITVFGLHPNSGRPDPTPQFRKWRELSKCFRPVWMILECRETGAMGVIKNPTIYEQQAVNPRIDPSRVTLLWEVNEIPEDAP